MFRYGYLLGGPVGAVFNVGVFVIGYIDDLLEPELPQRNPYDPAVPPLPPKGLGLPPPPVERDCGGSWCPP